MINEPLNEIGLVHVYEPGNATRYELLCIEIASGLDLFVWVNMPATLTKLAHDACIASSDLESRMGINRADAAALLAWLKAHKGYKVRMPTDYSPEGLYKPAPRRSAVHVLESLTDA